MPEQKLSIEDLNSANEKINADVARQCKISEAKVKEIMSFVGGYTADVIRIGAMERVMIPYFGKFKVKEKVLAFLNAKNRNTLNGKDSIYWAMKGYPIKDKPKKDETL